MPIKITNPLRRKVGIAAPEGLLTLAPGKSITLSSVIDPEGLKAHGLKLSGEADTPSEDAADQPPAAPTAPAPSPAKGEAPAPAKEAPAAAPKKVPGTA